MERYPKARCALQFAPVTQPRDTGDRNSATAKIEVHAASVSITPATTRRAPGPLAPAPLLPFEVARFDAVVCTVSVEYLTRPLEVFAEVRRVLKPGGRFITTFSNRWFPPKVIRIWQELHEEFGL